MGAVEYSGVVRKSRGLLIYKCNYNYWKVAERSFQSGGGEGTLAIAGSLLPFLLTRKVYAILLFGRSHELSVVRLINSIS